MFFFLKKALNHFQFNVSIFILYDTAKLFFLKAYSESFRLLQISFSMTIKYDQESEEVLKNPLETSDAGGLEIFRSTEDFR